MSTLPAIADVRRRLPVMAVAAWATCGTLFASDPIGVYALIDAVTTSPVGETPTEVRIDGLFCFSRGVGLGDYYTAPARGVVTYRLPETPKEAALARAQWSDLQRVAGSGEVIGYGSRWKSSQGLSGSLSDPSFGSAAPVQENPPPYPVHMELHRARADNPTARLLRQTLRPLAPGPDAVVDAGPVTFVARAPIERGADDAYLFLVESATGEVRASPPIAVLDGQDEVRWESPQVFFPGESVTWRVIRLQTDDGPRFARSRFARDSTYASVASSRFAVKEEHPPSWATDGDRGR